jgi:hypothetical protein
METLVTDPGKRADIIEKATRNISRFEWLVCAKKIASEICKRENLVP